MSRKSKELNLDVFDIPMGLFEYSVRIVIGERPNSLKYIAYVYEDKDYDQYVLEEEHLKNERPRGNLFRKPGYVSIFWIPTIPETSRDWATVSHEFVHATFEMFDWAHIPITRDTEELFGHSIGHLVNEFTEHMHKRKAIELKKKRV